MALTSITIPGYNVRAVHAVTRPLWLITDADQLASLPPALRAAADHIWLRPAGESPLPNAAAPDSAGWLHWRHGERLLAGNAAQLRALLTIAGRRYYLPVHFPGWDDLDLISLEPRCWSPTVPGASVEDSVELRVRIAAAVPATAPGASGVDTEPWQQLAAAVCLASAAPGEGVEALAKLAQQEGWHPLLRGLCLRNLIVALLRQRDWTSAGAVLQQARNLFPDYRDLDYLAARHALAAGRPGDVPLCLQRATQPAEGVWVGSGGESGYRAHHIWALISEQMGRQAMAVQHFMTGVRHAPAFAPAVAGVLRQRLPADLFVVARLELGRLARHEPDYAGPIFEFFLRHRAWEAAELALRAWPLTPDVRAALDERWRQTTGLRQSVPRPAAAPLGLVLSGPLQVHTSVARINRYLAAAFAADSGFDFALEPTAAAGVPLAEFPGAEAWAPALHRLPQRLDITVRHGWPPNLTPPDTGRLAAILPWEFGAVPRRWVPALQRLDRVFVPSAFVRGVLERAGVERVTVVPNGVDTALYHPDGERVRPDGARSVCFLFVGGAIRRKGMDLLLAAWREAFTAADDVSLVIKDLGANTFYRHLSLRDDIAALAADAGAAPVIYLEEEWSERRLPALYRGCDVLVLPYRGEGFGMPLAEALACGRPVITTAAGPAAEFCPAEASWLVPAAEVEMPAELRPQGRMTGVMTWFEPDRAALAAALRAAADCGPAGLAAQGALGGAHVRRTLGWDTVAAQYRHHIHRCA